MDRESLLFWCFGACFSFDQLAVNDDFSHPVVIRNSMIFQ